MPALPTRRRPRPAACRRHRPPARRVAHRVAPRLRPAHRPRPRPWSSAPTTSSVARSVSPGSCRRSGSCRRRRASPAPPWRRSWPSTRSAISTRRSRPPSRRAPSCSGISIKNGVATVDLSREFASGGGSASSFYRLGQVVYTLTQFSTVRSVLFQVEGQTVTTFGPRGHRARGPASPQGLPRPAPGDLRRSTGLRGRGGQPGQGHRQRRSLRGDLPDRDPRRVGQGRWSTSTR